MRANQGDTAGRNRTGRKLLLGALGGGMLLLGPFGATAKADPIVGPVVAPVLQQAQGTVGALPPAVCSSLYTTAPTLYPPCHQTLTSLALNTNNLRYFLFEGCYQYPGGPSSPSALPCLTDL